MSHYVDQRMQAWIGRTLLDRSGRRIGRIEDIYTDDVSGHPAWIAVATGRFGLNIVFLPFAGAIPAGGDELRVPFSKTRVSGAPAAGKGERLTRDEVIRLYDHYGFDLEAEEVRQRAGDGEPCPPPAYVPLPSTQEPSITSPPTGQPAGCAPPVLVTPVPPPPPRTPPIVTSPAPPPPSPPVASPAAPGQMANPPAPGPAGAPQAWPAPATPPTAPPLAPAGARLATPLAARLATPSEGGIGPDSPLLWNHEDRIDSIRPPREPAQTGRR